MSNFLMYFHEGINQSIDKQLINEKQAYDMKNCSIEKGNLSLCKGSTLFTSAALSYPIITLMKFYKDNIPTIVVATNNKLYKFNGSSWILIPGAYTNNYFDYINYQSGEQDITIFTNGIDPVKVYDNGSIRNLNNDGIVNDGSTSPKGKFIELHKERLWICGDAANPNRVYFSKDFNVDDWSMPIAEGEANEHGGFFDVPTFDGGKIIGMKTLFDDTIVFKTRNIFRIYGTYPGNFSVAQIFNIVDGEIIERSMASLDNRAYWLTTEGIFVWNGVEVRNLTSKVQDAFNNINKSYLANAVGVIWKHKYIIAVPSGTSILNDFVIEYDIQKDTYVIKKGFIVNAFLEVDGKLLFTDNTGKIFQYETGTSFNGIPIIGFWHTGDITFNTIEKRKRINSINFVASGDCTIRISVISEKKIKYKDIQLTASDTVYRQKIKNTGRVISIKIENLNGTNFKIKSPEVVYEIDE